MSVTKIDRSVIFILALCNFALVITVWGTLRVTPSDVLHEVRGVQFGVTSNTKLITDQIGDMHAELETRAEWMKAVDSELMKRTMDRIHRSEIEEWRQELAAFNQNLRVPELPSYEDECDAVEQ